MLVAAIVGAARVRGERVDFRLARFRPGLARRRVAEFLANEIEADGFKFGRSVRQTAAEPQQRFEILRRFENLAGLLNRRQPLLALGARGQDVAIGLEGARLVVGVRQGLGGAPDRVDVGAGQKHLVGGGDVDDVAPLLGVGGLDELVVRLGERQFVRQVRRGLPTRVLVLNRRDAGAHALVIMLGEEVPQRLLEFAVARLGEEILRRLPARMLFPQPFDFRRDARKVALAGEVAQCGEVDVAFAALACGVAVGRVGRRLGRRKLPRRRAGLNGGARRARRQVDGARGVRRDIDLRRGAVGRDVGENGRRAQARRLVGIGVLRSNRCARERQHGGEDKGAFQKHCGSLS